MGDSGSKMTDEQRAWLRLRMARHKAILESMDPECVVRVRAKAAVAMEQPIRRPVMLSRYLIPRLAGADGSDSNQETP